MKEVWIFIIFVLLVACASNVSAEIYSKEFGATYFPCDEVAPDRYQAQKKPKDSQSSTKSEEKLKDSASSEKTTEETAKCKVNLENVCAQYDTGLRCIKAPCPGVFKYIDFRTACEACRDLNVYGIFDRSCKEVNIEK